MSDLTRRDAVKLIAAAGATATAACTDSSRAAPENAMNEQKAAQQQVDPVLSVSPLPAAGPWRTPNPFLFCVHHVDGYPTANEKMGPAVSLAGRDMGQDFSGKDGWNMYHGLQVPGFPQHPHRGFETITVVRRGLIDHADSLGAAARYGEGDVQWLTAGRGINHAEMFPLLDQSGPNPLELFQIWLNLPKADKMVDPYFSMFWSDSVPRQVVKDEEGRSIEVTVVAGNLGELRPPAPPPNSWAARADADVALWTLKLAPFAKYTLPAASSGANRSLYFFKGSGLRVGSRTVTASKQVDVRADLPVHLENGPDEAEVLVLQGRPINEPIVQHGPFVMNSREEIIQTIRDYQSTQFGGWPWPNTDPVHGREDRFARHADGRIERPV